MRVPSVVAVALLVVGCKDAPSAAPDAGPALVEVLPPPSATVADTVAVPSATPPPDAPRPTRCPAEMVFVRDTVCVDRWEAQLVDKNTGKLLSPYYPPMRKLAQRLHDEWETARFTRGGPTAQAVPVPPLPAWQTEVDVEPMAVARAGVVPAGYVSGNLAERACKNAGKRLCTSAEWVTACRGASDRPYPYGDSYQTGKCNIFRSKHPAAVLHDDASVGHLDPRLNTVKEGSDPLLRPTGGTPTCSSQWGDDAIYDMNGNLDEWVEDEKGRFQGGFFSRSKTDGCQSKVTAHPKGYFDYSTGVRCCSDPTPRD